MRQICRECHKYLQKQGNWYYCYRCDDYTRINSKDIARKFTFKREKGQKVGVLTSEVYHTDFRPLFCGDDSLQIAHDPMEEFLSN